MQAAPMARLQQKKQAAVTTGKAGTTGIPCAMVLRLIARSPRTPARTPGFDCLRRLAGSSPLRLDPSIGDQDHTAFAVREDAFVGAQAR
jgi:hypothetical protein